MNKRCFLLLVICFNMSGLTESHTESKVLSRRKRYVAFPEGASFSLAACVTVGILGQPVPKYGLFTWGMNWAMSYVLPNSTEVADVIRPYRNKALQRRRERRDLYRKLETILDNIGYNGRECVLKTLCETVQRITSHDDNMLEEIFRTLFTLPTPKVLQTEPTEHKIYDTAHRAGFTEHCDSHQCPISLVDWMKGYYNAPSPAFDVAKSPWATASSSLS